MSAAESIVPSSSLQEWFAPFRRHIIGIDQTFEPSCGTQRSPRRLDRQRTHVWPARRRDARPHPAPSGQYAYRDQRDQLTMTLAYHHALKRIKQHVNAGPNHALICYGTGMTAVVNSSSASSDCACTNASATSHSRRPVNARWCSSVTWSTTRTRPRGWRMLCDVRVIDRRCREWPGRSRRARPPARRIPRASTQDRQRDLVLERHRPVHALPRHRRTHASRGRPVFRRFRLAARLIDIGMRPPGRPEAQLDAIFFSPHKFSAARTPGVLVFDQKRQPHPRQPGRRHRRLDQLGRTQVRRRHRGARTAAHPASCRRSKGGALRGAEGVDEPGADAGARSGTAGHPVAGPARDPGPAPAGRQQPYWSACCRSTSTICITTWRYGC